MTDQTKPQDKTKQRRLTILPVPGANLIIYPVAALVGWVLIMSPMM